MLYSSKFCASHLWRCWCMPLNKGLSCSREENWTGGCFAPKVIWFWIKICWEVTSVLVADGFELSSSKFTLSLGDWSELKFCCLVFRASICSWIRSETIVHWSCFKICNLISAPVCKLIVWMLIYLWCNIFKISSKICLFQWAMHFFIWLSIVNLCNTLAPDVIHSMSELMHFWKVPVLANLNLQTIRVGFSTGGWYCSSLNVFLIIRLATLYTKSCLSTWIR